MSDTKPGWTVEQLEWLPWLATVPRETATPEQLAVIEESSPSGNASPYYELLAHEPGVLRERSRLFKAVMYGGRDGLSRAERELATVAVSRINGCVYCASVHGRLFGQLSQQPEVIQRIFDDGIDAELGQRYRALVDYAAVLTRDAAGATAADIEPLRQAGLSDLEILDATHAIAMFAWANRLMQTLGEPTREAQQ